MEKSREEISVILRDICYKLEEEIDKVGMREVDYQSGESFLNAMFEALSQKSSEDDRIQKLLIENPEVHSYLKTPRDFPETTDKTELESILKSREEELELLLKMENDLKELNTISNFSPKNQIEETQVSESTLMKAICALSDKIFPLVDKEPSFLELLQDLIVASRNNEPFQSSTGRSKEHIQFLEKIKLISKTDVEDLWLPLRF